jgi:hypothetical protein
VGERRAPVGACSVLLLTAGVEERRSRSQSRGGESALWRVTGCCLGLDWNLPSAGNGNLLSHVFGVAAVIHHSRKK